MKIVRLTEIDNTPTLMSGLDEVFYAASNTKAFASELVRQEFRERWLGRYIAHDANHFYVACADDDSVAGYLAGCLDDPAQTSRFSDIPYVPHFAELTGLYPAHLHVNLRADVRSQGTGTALVSRFLGDARQAGAPGVHVVTSRGARNVRFYNRNGFSEKGAFGEGAREVVFLAKPL